LNRGVQLQTLGTLDGLINSLEGLGQGGRINTVFMVSLEGMPVDLTDETTTKKLIHEFATFGEWHKATSFQITEFEYAFLAKIEEDHGARITSDLKIRVLGIIQELYPDYFHDVDQSRVVRRIPVPLRLDKFFAYIKSRQAQMSANDTGGGKHKLCETDLNNLKQFFSKITPQDIAANFISRQAIYLIKGTEPPKPVAEEFFVSIKALSQTVLKDVDLRGSAALFDHMTVYLDRILLRSLKYVPDRTLPLSINLNIGSVFSSDFKKFTQLIGDKDLERMQIEFRQADILLHLSKYNLVSQVLSGYKGSTVIDAVLPDTLGLIRLNRLSPSFVKIFWQGEGDVDLNDKRDDIQEIVASGVFPVLARIDEEAGLKTGLGLGIKLFQGFYLDSLTKKA